MLHVLFSPSEGKQPGGDVKPISLLGSLESRAEILQSYQEIITGEDKEQIKALFGFKKFDECLPYIVDIYTAPTLKAIMRYDGVAYNHLAYNGLSLEAQAYIDTHTIIFSNLFGPIKADDQIPIYKVKQGNAIGSIKPEQFYKERFSYQLDLFLAQSEILDLRAGYYDKFYKPNKPFTTLKFLKNGKVVSHWAKAYRGIVLKEMAKHQVESLEQLYKMPIENLAIEEIRKLKNKTEVIYRIVS